MLIAISGKIGSGKSTASEIIKTYYPEFDFEIINFADKPKQIVAALCNVDINLLYSQEGKNTFIPLFNKTLGEMLQYIANDVFRKNMGENVWIDVLFNSLDKSKNYIIGDLRYKDELESILLNNGIVIRIERDNNDIRDNSKRNLNHISETDLDDVEFKHVIKNNKDLNYLAFKIVNYLTEYI